MNPRPLSLDALRYICRNLRQADKAEIWPLHYEGEEEAGLVHGVIASAPLAWSFDYRGVPAAAVGAREVRPGVWGVWGFGTVNFRRVGFSVTRHIRRRIIPALHSVGAHRAECLSLSTNHRAHRWLECLGAEHEATLKGAGRGGEDYRIYVWRRQGVNVRAAGGQQHQP